MACAVDVWSFGVLLWELLTCEVPYKGVDAGAIVWGVGSGGLKLPIPRTAPDGFSLLLQQCWHENPHHRPAFRQILIHLDILADDSEFGVLPEQAYLTNQKTWRREVVATVRNMKEEDELSELEDGNMSDASTSRAPRFTSRRSSLSQSQSQVTSPSRDVQAEVEAKLAAKLAAIAEAEHRLQQRYARARHLLMCHSN